MRHCTFSSITLTRILVDLNWAQMFARSWSGAIRYFMVSLKAVSSFTLSSTALAILVQMPLMINMAI